MTLSNISEIIFFNIIFKMEQVYIVLIFHILNLLKTVGDWFAFWKIKYGKKRSLRKCLNVFCVEVSLYERAKLYSNNVKKKKGIFPFLKFFSMFPFIFCYCEHFV